MSETIVGVYDSSFRQLFAGAHIMKASVGPSAKLPEHPLENGSSTMDHIIFPPVPAEFAVILDPATYQDTYKQLARSFANGELFIIQTRVRVLPNMILQAIPHEETSEVADTVSMVLKFLEWRTFSPSYAKLPPKKVANKSQSSTQPRGQQAAAAPKASTGSVLSKIVAGLSS